MAFRIGSIGVSFEQTPTLPIEVQRTWSRFQRSNELNFST